jgi:hypothetical protein
VVKASRHEVKRMGVLRVDIVRSHGCEPARPPAG